MLFLFLYFFYLPVWPVFFLQSIGSQLCNASRHLSVMRSDDDSYVSKISIYCTLSSHLLSVYHETGSVGHKFTHPWSLLCIWRPPRCLSLAVIPLRWTLSVFMFTALTTQPQQKSVLWRENNLLRSLEEEGWRGRASGGTGCIVSGLVESQHRSHE